jgi:hypothetical protein
VHFLRLAPAPLAWIVLFDAHCVWHLAPDTLRLKAAQRASSTLRFASRPVPVWTESHAGWVRLPTGDSLKAGPLVFAAHSAVLGRSYLVLALPSRFRSDSAAAADPLLEQRILSVVSHELLHTRQLPALQEQIDRLKQSHTVPGNLNDDVIQRRFSGDSGFRRAFELERDLLYEAVQDLALDRACETALRALAAIRARRTRYFVGENRVYGPLEELFLNLEGTAEWLRFKIHQADTARFRSDAEIVAFIRGRQNDWVQDEGLALLLLLERFDRSGPSLLVDDQVRSPIAVLSRAAGKACGD